MQNKLRRVRKIKHVPFPSIFLYKKGFILFYSILDILDIR